MAAIDVFLLGSLASLIAGLGTGLGALPIFLLRRMGVGLETTLLSLAAGIMLAASVFSLVMPALEVMAERGASPFGASVTVAAALMLGGGVFWIANRFIPHEHFFKGREGIDGVLTKRLWLFVAAITLHNFPEGLSVGAGFGQPDLGKGMALAIGIAIQNMPEGFVVALALVALRHSAAFAFMIALLTGLVEPVGGLIGAAAVAFVQPILPWALAFAAGTMIFVVGGEMIPETHRKGHETRATFGLLSGFALMVLLGGLF